MLRVLIKSRTGNIVLGLTGIAYAIASLAVLIVLMIDIWQAASVGDLLIQLALIGAAGCGIWFALNARENLAQGGPVRRHSLGGTSNPASAHR